MLVNSKFMQTASLIIVITLNIPFLLLIPSQVYSLNAIVIIVTNQGENASSKTRKRDASRAGRQ